MSTPIEELRALLRRGHDAVGVMVSTENLRSVLEAAERFAALERHVPAVWVRDGIAFLNYAWQVDAGGRRAIKLSELADRLREENK